MKNGKKILSLLLSVIMVLGVCAAGFTVSADRIYLYVGGVRIDIENSGSYYDGKVVYDAESHTLTFNDFDLTYSGSCIYAQFLDLTITGSAKLTVTSSGSYAVAVDEGNLTLNGDLAIRSQCKTGPAVTVFGNLTVEGGSLSVINTDSDAIFVQRMTVNGGSVYAKGGSSSNVAIASGDIIRNNGEKFALGDEDAKEVLIKVPGTLAGAGTALSPYMIFDYTDLKAFSSKQNGGEYSAHAKLMKDIDASASASANDWTPIAYYDGRDNSKRYTGTFDGDGHKITGLVCNKPELKNAGLFSLVGEGGKVRNTGLEGGSITGKCFAGGVVGANTGTVTNCYSTGTVTATGETIRDDSNAYAGGVVGSNTGTVTNCYSTGTVTATAESTGDAEAYAGGVAGYNIGTVTNCYSTGTVTATAESTGDVSQANVGGVVGFNNNTLTNCYYDSDICTGVNAIGYGSGTNVKGLTTAEMTGETALDNMVFEYGAGEEDPWLTKANNENSAYYPHLKGFAYDTDPTDANWPPKIEAPVTTYPLWVGGNQVTSENMGALEELDGISVDDGGSVKFEPDADGTGGTLYLNNATITGTQEYDFGRVFTSNVLVENTDFDLTINLEGENILNGGEEGICLPNENVPAALTIEGEGSLDITAVEEAIFCNGSLTVDGTTLTATATPDDEDYLPDGIYSWETKIIGSTVTVTANGSNGTGFYCHGLLDIDGSVVTATGGRTGIYVDNYITNGGLTVSGISAVTAEGGNELGAIFSKDGYHFEDGNDIVTPENFKYGTFGVGTIVLNSDDSAATTVVIGQTCTVTFNDYNGTELQSGKILKGTAPEYKGETPTRTDPSGGYTYAFSGWKDGNNNEYAPGAAFPAAEGDITYTAQFTETPVDYTVTFFVDGKQYSQLTVPFGAPVSSPRTPQKDNYDFIGWDAEIPEKMPAHNLEFNALFEKIKYPVWLAGNRITPDNMDWLGELEGVTVANGGYIRFEPNDDETGGTLYLKNAVLSGEPGQKAVIYVPDGDFDLDIVFSGENIISGADCGILTEDGDSLLTVTGDGMLQISANGDAVHCNNFRYNNPALSFRLDGYLLINSYGINDAPSYGICADSISIPDGAITVYSYSDEGSALSCAPELNENLATTGSTDPNNIIETAYSAADNASYRLFTTSNRAITFMNEDGVTPLRETEYFHAYNEINLTVPEAPAKTDPDGKYEYPFAGWTDANGNLYAPDEPLTYMFGFNTFTATYTQTPKKYTAKFVADGKTVEEVKFTFENDSITEPAVPVKEGYNGEWEEYELTPGGITVKPVYTPEDICPLDEEYHGETFWGRLVKFFHTVIWKAFNLVGINIYLKIW